MATIDPNTEARTDKTVRKTVPVAPKDDQPGWGIPILFAAVAFVAGILIFSTAGPEHMRTANVDQSKTQSVPAQQNADIPAAPKQQ